MDTCPHCRSRDVVRFTLEPAGEPLHLSHCRSCEHRWWTDVAGGDIRLPEVLGQIGDPAS